MSFTSHMEASEVLGKVYEVVLQARVYRTWARKQLLSAEENVDFTERQLRAAEHQVIRAVRAIENDGFMVFYEDSGSSGVHAMPYVVEIEHSKSCICYKNVIRTDYC